MLRDTRWRSCAACRNVTLRLEPACAAGEQPGLRAGPSPARILVVGLGNPILKDDGVGWQVVQQAARRWQTLHSTAPDHAAHTSDAAGAEAAQVEFDCVALGGLALMERLVGYERVLLVDAIQTHGGLPGTCYRCTADDLPTLHANSAHDASLNVALGLGRRLGAYLPEAIDIIAIEVETVTEFGEELSPRVATAAREAAEVVVAELARLVY
jgi:hydrogenase maturation protease